MNLAALYSRLHEESLVATAEAPAMPPLEPPAPWYTRAMLGFAGWIAGLFLVSFFGSVIVMLFRDGPGMLLLAAGLLLGAVMIDRRMRGEVMVQFALALSMAGQAFYALGFDKIFASGDSEAAAWALVVLEVVLFAVLRSSLHRVMCVAIGAGALYYALHRHGLAGAAAGVIAVAFAVLWAHEDRWRASRHGPAGAALGWGLALALGAWAAPSLFTSGEGTVRVLEGAGYGLGLMTYAALATRSAAVRDRVLVLAAAGLLALAAHAAPGVIAGALIVVAGFGARHRVMAALGALGIVAYLGAYYYQLDQTLLAKASALAATGLALLIARLVVTRAWKEEKP